MVRIMFLEALKAPFYFAIPAAIVIGFMVLQ